MRLLNIPLVASDGRAHHARGRGVKKFRGVLVVVLAIAAFAVLSGGSAVAAGDEDVVLVPKVVGDPDEGSAPPSGFMDFRDVDVGNAITECPRAGEPVDKSPKPLNRRTIDDVEKLSNGGNDNLTNQDYACFPQDETSIAINPTNPKNAIGGANDYRLGWGSSGFYATTNNGNAWYDSSGAENADKCAWTFSGTLVSFKNSQWKIQGNWSNAANNVRSGYDGAGCIQTS